MSAAVVVVGSLNADLTIYTQRMPRPGETLVGTDFAVHPGGKSANQAVAAAKVGAHVRMIGAVGNDANGELLLDSVGGAGVDVTPVLRLDGVPTGVAGITVDAQGENSIVIVPGANGELSSRHVEDAADVFEGAAVVCLCLEVDQATVEAAALAGRAAGATVVLNLSPSAPLSGALRGAVDVLLINAHEAGDLLGRPVDPAAADWAQVGAELAELGFGRVIVTLGADGSVVLEAGEPTPVTRIEPTTVTAVDTTGSGDAFTGTLAARLAQGDALADAARYASVAAALAATRHGAQPSYADAAEVESRLR